MYIICLPIGTGRVISVSVFVFSVSIRKSSFVINLWFYENIVSVLNDRNVGNKWEVIGVEV